MAWKKLRCRWRSGALVVLALSVLLIAASEPPHPLAIRERKVGEQPSVGDRSQGEVGTVIYEKFDYWEYPLAALTEKLSEHTMLTDVELPIGMKLVVAAERTKRGGKDPNQYCTIIEVAHFKGVATQYPVCLRDLQGDQRFDEIFIEGTGAAIARWRALKDSRPSFERLPQGLIDVGFRRQLVFSGRAGDVLTLLYREYTESGFARPAFTQEVTYTVDSEGRALIRFRGAEIEVHGAGNEGLDYTIKAGMKD